MMGAAAVTVLACMRSWPFTRSVWDLMSRESDDDAVTPQVDGVKNPKVQSVFFDDMPVHRAAFADGGAQVGFCCALRTSTPCSEVRGHFQHFHLAIFASRSSPAQSHGSFRSAVGCNACACHVKCNSVLSLNIVTEAADLPAATTSRL